MKHAYLILAHADFDLLSLLISAIDDERNDIFIHVDKKVTTIPTLFTSKSTLVILDDRVDVRWGDISVIEAEFHLFRAALQSGQRYGYLHLLSGVDLPLHSQDTIHSFFEEHSGKEFIGFSQYDYSKEVSRKMEFYHLFSKHFRSNNLCYRLARGLFLRLQMLLGMKRNVDIILKKGTQWVSITPAFAQYVLEQEQEILKRYSYTFCCDEVVLHTVCWNSPFREHVYNLCDEAVGCARLIGWSEGQIHDWTYKDIDTLMTSTAMFARKFSTKHMDVAHEVARKSLQSKRGN